MQTYKVFYRVDNLMNHVRGKNGGCALSTSVANHYIPVDTHRQQCTRFPTLGTHQPAVILTGLFFIDAPPPVMAISE